LRCTAEKAFLDVTVSRLCVALLHAKTDGIAEGFKVDLIDGHPGKITKSSTNFIPVTGLVPAVHY